LQVLVALGTTRRASATSDDVPGLVTESKTFEGLLKKLRTMVPELLELNGAMRA